jgi:hypothetical protein
MYIFLSSIMYIYKYWSSYRSKIQSSHLLPQPIKRTLISQFPPFFFKFDWLGLISVTYDSNQDFSLSLESTRSPTAKAYINICIYIYVYIYIYIYIHIYIYRLLSISWIYQISHSQGLRLNIYTSKFTVIMLLLFNMMSLKSMNTSDNINWAA